MQVFTQRIDHESVTRHTIHDTQTMRFLKWLTNSHTNPSRAIVEFPKHAFKFLIPYK